MLRGGGVVLFAEDVARAVGFYVETLGLKLVREQADGSATVDAGEGFTIELWPSQKAMGAPKSAPRLTVLYPKVPIEQAVAVFENRGIEFKVTHTATETVARFVDTEGNDLALVAPR